MINGYPINSSAINGTGVIIMSFVFSNEFRYRLGKGELDFSDTGAGAFRIILMQSKETFLFGKDAHGSYADVKSSELANGNGYTQLDKNLVIGNAWAQNNTDNKAAISWDNIIWTASSGNIGPISAAIILQYDATDPGGDGAIGDLSLIVGCINLGQDVIVADGLMFQLQNLGFDLVQGT